MKPNNIIKRTIETVVLREKVSTSLKGATSPLINDSWADNRSTQESPW